MTFRECLNVFKFIPNRNKNIQIKIRLIYGLAKLLTDLGRYRESNALCIDGLFLCKKYESLYLFGELHYQCGSNYARKGDNLKAANSFEKAINIFEIQDNYSFVEEVKTLREELLHNK